MFFQTIHFFTRFWCLAEICTSILRAYSEEASYVAYSTSITTKTSCCCMYVCTVCMHHQINNIAKVKWRDCFFARKMKALHVCSSNVKTTDNNTPSTNWLGNPNTKQWKTRRRTTTDRPFTWQKDIPFLPRVVVVFVLIVNVHNIALRQCPNYYDMLHKKPPDTRIYKIQLYLFI